ncbi:MAG: hypothetical protein IPK77_16460 [Cellvibrio sp.]|nr:hypothetical protein [Cellvibrio sp.]
MRATKFLAISLICITLTACVSSLLIGNKVQSKLMWSFLKPLVGFDPNEVNLFETPMIKNRMTKLLGDKYEPTMKLLRTAQEIQQEGALFYVASRYAPPKVQAITDKAGMVWNADTNQMAVVLIKDGIPQIFSEQIENAKEKITPALPQELKNAYDTAIEKKKELDALKDKIETAQDTLENIPEKVGNMAAEKVDQLKNQATEKVIEKTEEKILESVTE